MARVNEVLTRTVVVVVVVVVDSDRGFDNLCGSHLQSESEFTTRSRAVRLLECPL